MRIIADLHIHSRFSRACSKDLNFPNLAKAAQMKGIQWLGSGDILHPIWRKEAASVLDGERGSYYLKDGASPTAFCLSTEVSCIYKRHDKVRRVHHVILFPDFAAAEKTAEVLEDRGFNLKSDGRPIMGLDSEDLVRLLMEIDRSILLIPAHAWTPWFAIFGSKSGFDSLEECFGEQTEYIYAIETGLSSDPAMNWRISGLDSLFLVSNSDAHSCENLGREANVFELEKPDYPELHRILAEHDAGKFIETLEFFPEEGKYHADGHADCGFWCEPEKTEKLGGRCPKCGRLLTVGVLSRVNELADRPSGCDRPKGSVPYRSTVPLRELVADCMGKGKTSKAVQSELDRMRENGSEFAMLLDYPKEKLDSFCRPEITEGILKARAGEIDIRPGYDGVFGEIKVRKEKMARGQQFLL